jgi:hypothetical protein
LISRTFTYVVFRLTHLADALFFGRSSRSESAYFVVARRRNACLLVPPQHGGARCPTDATTKE